LALTRMWWGPAREPSPPTAAPHQKNEPFVLRAVIVTLVGLLLVAGLWPEILQMFQWGRP